MLLIYTQKMLFICGKMHANLGRAQYMNYTNEQKPDIRMPYVTLKVIKIHFVENPWQGNRELYVNVFWKEIKIMNHNNVLLPYSIDDAVGEHDIAKLWIKHFMDVFNCIKDLSCESTSYDISNKLRWCFYITFRGGGCH